MPAARAILAWALLALAIAVPLALAVTSPLLAWREPIYIAAGLAGVLALCLLLVQPLLVGGLLPGVKGRNGRKWHQWLGGLLLGAVILHVVGLWITSPPDVIDALLFVSPTPFSAWGVIAMWALFAAAILSVFRPRISAKVWRLGHTTLVIIVVAGTVIHALLIEGTMEPISKVLLSVLAGGVLLKVLLDLRAWTLLRRRRPRSTKGLGLRH
ncbi:MAG: ferric reductase-like transmembrane domain-containing protein [Pseudomonadota bacterium]